MKKVNIPCAVAIAIVAVAVLIFAMVGHSTPTPPTDSTPTTDGLGHNITDILNAGIYTFMDDIGQQWDNGSVESVGKQAIFNIEQAVWQSTLSPDAVAVNILGPVLDKYGHQSEATLLSATLQKDTANQFVWDNLDSDSAWNAYDNTWLSPILTGN